MILPLSISYDGPLVSKDADFEHASNFSESKNSVCSLRYMVNIESIWQIEIGYLKLVIDRITNRDQGDGTGETLFNTSRYQSNWTPKIDILDICLNHCQSEP